MRFSFSAVGAVALSMVPLGQASALRRDNSSGCIVPEPVPDLNGTDLRNFGMVLYRAVDVLDVFGPLDILQLMAHLTQQMNLYMIAETLDPVTTETLMPSMNPYNSSFWPVITPTHTFDDDLDIDVLIVPGGPGMRTPGMQAELDYLVKMYPRVKLFIAVCTGSGLAARAGVLDGKLATTNKNAWSTVLAMGPEVKWVSPARYVRDGKTWTSSGVTAALDLTHSLVETYWGSALADRVFSIVEHVPRVSSDDPFSTYFNITPTEAQICAPESKRGAFLA